MPEADKFVELGLYPQTAPNFIPLKAGLALRFARRFSEKDPKISQREVLKRHL